VTETTFPVEYETVLRWTADTPEQIQAVHDAVMVVGQAHSNPDVVCGWSLPATKADAERTI
jgi:hypothetical protein